MESPNTTQPKQYRVHKILAHSYAMFFVLFLFSVALDLVFKIRIFKSSVTVPFGLVLLVIGTLLVLWAQKSSRNLNIQNLTKETFSAGPYRYTRHPTHWGLFFMMLGFGIIANALFVILFTLISLFVAKRVFIEKQENVLDEKYGTPYLEYKKSVKL